MFNDYNVSLHLKAMCTLDNFQTNTGYFGHVKKMFRNVSRK